VRTSPSSQLSNLLLRRGADRGVARLLFAGGAGLSFVGAVVFALPKVALQPGLREWLVGGCLLACAVFLLLVWLADRLPLEKTVLVAAWVGCVTIGAATHVLGAGTRTPLLGIWPLLIAVAAVLASVPSAALLAVACAAFGAALAIDEASHPLPAVALAGSAADGPLLSLVTLAATLAAGLAVGALLSLSLRRSLRQIGAGEQRSHALVAMTADWVWELDAEFRFTRFEAAPGTTGTTPDELLGCAPWEVSDFGFDDDALDALRADLEARQPFNGLLMRSIDASGRTHFISASGTPFNDDRGVFRGYWGIGRDISAQVHAEQAAQASAARFQELFERSPTPLVLHRSGRVVEANLAAARMCGFGTPQSVIGFDLRQLYPDGAAREQAIAELRQLEQEPLGSDLPVTDFMLRAPDGRQLTVQSTAVRVIADGGPATLSIFFDVTARRATEAALRRSDALLSHLFATSPGCITLTELASGRYVLVNPGFTRVTGYAASEVAGRTETEVGIWHRAADRERLVAAVRERGHVDDWAMTIVTKSDALASIQLSAARFEMDGKDYLVVNAHDITETERARIEHAAILQNASIGIAFTRDGRFRQVNPSWERMFGCETGQLAGQRIESIWADPPADAELRARSGPGSAGAKPLEIVREMRRMDGSLFWCRLLGQTVNAANPVHDGTLWIAEDISEQRRIDVELATALDQAEAASRAKSAFLANTSHEIRTPLNGLLGLARMAMQPALDPGQRDQYLGQIVDSAQSLADIISDVLDLSRIEAGKLTLEVRPFDLREQLRSLHRSYLALARAKGLQLSLTMADEVPEWVLGDVVRTRQIVVNLLSNAIKFTDAGAVRIDVSGRSERGVDGPGKAAQECVRIVVSDTGPGIDAKTQQRLFQPFSQADESTTRRYGGNGLGLSICRQLARLMGGEVGVQSEPGRGSRFWVELPLAPTALPPAEPEHTVPDPRRLRGARVLMVEDNPVNMMIAVAQLEQFGTHVDEACDGQEAIEAVERAAAEGHPYDVVLMDLQMPRMGGNEATRVLRRRFPAGELPIIALTAAALVSERELALKAGMVPPVEKLEFFSVLRSTPPAALMLWPSSAVICVLVRVVLPPEVMTVRPPVWMFAPWLVELFCTPTATLPWMAAPLFLV